MSWAQTAFDAVDKAPLLLLRRPDNPALPIGPEWGAGFFQSLTDLGSIDVVGPLTIVAVIALIMLRHRWAAVMMVLSLAGAWLSYNVIKQVVDRPRPTIVPHLTIVNDPSFPSGHSTDAAAVYFSLAIAVTVIRCGSLQRSIYLFLATAIVALIGFSRLYLGVHYPTDVLGGWALGTLCACLSYRIARRLRPEAGH
jgi:undecaprenyl-diphosphatase